MTMKGKELVELLKGGAKPSVEFEADIENYECMFDEGMRGRLIRFNVNDHGDLCLSFEVKEYEGYNIPLMKPLYEDKNNVPCLKVIETPYYPDNGIEDIYFSLEGDVPLLIVEDNPLYKEFQDSGKKSYMMWLEQQVLDLRKKLAENE